MIDQKFQRNDALCVVFVLAIDSAVGVEGLQLADTMDMTPCRTNEKT